eukprot:1143599-Pelagomonas_calceolata.AAC.1
MENSKGGAALHPTVFMEIIYGRIIIEIISMNRTEEPSVHNVTADFCRKPGNAKQREGTPTEENRRQICMQLTSKSMCTGRQSKQAKKAGLQSASGDQVLLPQALQQNGKGALNS